MVKVLFVCLGNICRSPSAEGVFRKLVIDENLSENILTDSAGTGAWHIGHAPDSRAIYTALQRGIDLSDLRARQVSAVDFSTFDYIIAMDEQNYADLERLSGESSQDKISLFMDYAENFTDTEVPDPYYGGDNGFEVVLDMIEDAAQGLLKTIQAHHG